MEGAVILEQLIGVILAALTIIFSVVGPVLYYSFKFTSTKVDELRLQISNFIRMVLENIIKRIYRLVMTAAVLIQTFIDIVEMVTAIKAEKAKAMSPEEKLGKFFKWVEAELAKSIKRTIKERIKSVAKKIVGKFIRSFSEPGAGAIFKVVARQISKRFLGKKAVIAAVGAMVGLLFLRNIVRHWLMGEVEETGLTEVMKLGAILAILAVTTAWLGGFVIVMAEIIFRLVIPTMDKFFYTSVSENIIGKDTNTTLRKIMKRIEFCWRAFGAGKSNVNYMRINPIPCSVTVISSYSDPIQIRNITEGMKKIEEKYLERNQTFFSNGRFVFMVKECNGTTGECYEVGSFTCEGEECWSSTPPALNVLSEVNLDISYRGPGSIEDEIVAKRELSVGIMYTSFGECVPWDSYTANGIESPFWKKEMFGEMTLVQWAAFVIGAESLFDLRCLLKDTLYITFLIPKEKNITVVFEEGT